MNHCLINNSTDVTLCFEEESETIRLINIELIPSSGFSTLTCDIFSSNPIALGEKLLHEKLLKSININNEFFELELEELFKVENHEELRLSINSLGKTFQYRCIPGGGGMHYLPLQLELIES